MPVKVDEKTLAFLRYWIPVFFSLALIFYLSSLPASEIPTINFPEIDKIEHFLAYSLVGFCFFRALTYQVRLTLLRINIRRALFLAWIFGSLYGASDEFHQSFVPGREVSFFDFLADSSGSLFGALVAIQYRRLIKYAIVKKNSSRLS